MHITPVLIGLAALGCLAVLAACGSSNYNSAATTNPSASDLTLSECMHSHGIKNFPDPTTSAGGGGGLGLELSTSPGGGTVIANGITFSGPAFKAAAQACKKLLPGGGGPPPPPTAEEKQRALEFAACMRTHGVPTFPDPTFSTAGAAKRPPAGIDPSSPAFQHAARACGGGTVRLG